MAERKKTRKAGGAGKAAARRSGKRTPASRPPAGRKKKPTPAPRAKAAAAAARKPAVRPVRPAPAAPRPARKTARAPGRARGLAVRARPAREPDPESYFVARVRGEEAVRDSPHPMTEAAMETARGAPAPERPPSPGHHDEGLGDLPWSYGDDALVALPRDPRTLYLYWDHAARTVEQAFAGLSGGKPQLWIFAGLPGGGWERVRVLDFALEARGWYVHELEPGRLYRAEIHAVDPGQDRLLPRPSNAVLLPPVGPSPLVDDRFARIAWGEHLARWLAEWRAGGPFAEELRAQMLRLSDWSRFAGETWGGSAGGMGGRPSSPTAPPGSPTSPRGGR